MRLIVFLTMLSIAVAPVMVGYVAYLKTDPHDAWMAAWFAIGTAICLWGMYFLQGLRRIPAKPPHKALVTKFGERQMQEIEVTKPGQPPRTITVTVYKDEGWRFFPLYPYWYGFLPIKVERISFTVTIKGARTPDRANSEVPVHLTIRPASDYLIQYVDSGEEDGVKTILTGKIQERVREWAMADNEGPADWRELNKAHLEAVSVLVRTVTGRESVTSIPEFAQNVPTFVWLTYFSRPRPTAEQVFKNIRPWAENGWQLVENVFYALTPAQQNELWRAVEARRNEIRDLRSGAGKLLIPDLGVLLERLNIGDINVLGGVAERADAQAREVEEREGERLELEHVRNRILELMAPPTNYSAEKALEVVQTERGKVPKTIREEVLNISPETRGALPEILGALRRLWEVRDER
jgi:hypothetical protein